MPKELKKTKRFSVDLSFLNYEKFVKRAKKNKRDIKNEAEFIIISALKNEE